MVNKKNRAKRKKKQDGKRRGGSNRNKRIKMISAGTDYGVCSERISSYGGLLGLVKFLDLVGFEEAFEKIYAGPKRKSKLGCYRMILGMLILLFVGFQRIGHILYVRDDSIISGILKVARLPVVSTFWRYLSSMGSIQSESLLELMGELRGRVWSLAGYKPSRVNIDIDTTVATVYGKIEGAKKGYNPKHRGKKGLRPVLCFLEETGEYICGEQRHGQTISREEVARHIRSFGKYLPSYVKSVLVRGDEEFVGWESVAACLECGYEYIFASQGCRLPLEESVWESQGGIEYTECEYQPKGWQVPSRFVVMRVPKKAVRSEEYLIKEEAYIYRAFATNRTSNPREVVMKYDKRANVENRIGEAQREGILAIASKRFESHSSFFQLVMMAYNLWRWMKQLAGCQSREENGSKGTGGGRVEIVNQTVRVTRLIMLYIGAKISSHANREKVYYSIHDSRTEGLTGFLAYLDKRRSEMKPWQKARDPTPLAIEA